jgi:hypothetical protein
MKKFDYADEKLKAVCRGLATGEGDVRSRLVNIFSTLERLMLEEYLPSELSPQLTKIISDLTKKPALRTADGSVLRTSVQQSMHGKHNRKAAQIAGEIFDLKSSLDRYHLELEFQQAASRCLKFHGNG